MPNVWPRDAFLETERIAVDALRGFQCLLLMPFLDELAPAAKIIEAAVRRKVDQYALAYPMFPAKVERLDWLTSSEIIHAQLWEKVKQADLVFCDITGLNPNVMFEYGICAAIKRIQRVLVIKNRSSEQRTPFNISPVRYTEYDLDTFGIDRFVKWVEDRTWDALMAFPDDQAASVWDRASSQLNSPVLVDFANGHDDGRIYTPPLAHRRVIDGALEFGAHLNFLLSWATIETYRPLTFKLAFKARFSHPLETLDAYIGVGLRSQHPWAGHGHIFYLRRDGEIRMCHPDDSSKDGFKDVPLRDKQTIDHSAEHQFEAVFNDSALSVRIDDIERIFPLREMTKLLGAGLIRFQSSLTWMAVRQITLEPL